MPPDADTDPQDDRHDGRDETPTQRADRNWGEVLQELRVLQTGTQILTGFLLALAFQQTFADGKGAEWARLNHRARAEVAKALNLLQ